jgi:DNA-binding winged helix-turn-helix (wHTH) protein/Tol biopolymer transport system component
MGAQRELDRRPLHFGVFELHPASGELRKHGVRVRLQDQPFKLLLCLLETPGEICTREDLIRRIWPEGTFVDYERGLNVAITRLRQVLGDSADTPRYVETVGRKGYRFIAPVDRLPAPENAREGPALGIDGRATGQPQTAVLAMQDEPPVAIEKTVVPPSRLGIVATAFAVLLMVALGAIDFVRFREAAPEERVIRLTIPVPRKSVVGYMALSPDGRRLAAVLLEDKLRLWLRPLDSSQFQVLPNTDNARSPFWSPDGRFIGFFADGKLKTIPASGGPPQVLCDAGLGLGGSWNRDGVILFATQLPGPILRVNAAGGPCTPATKAEPNSVHGFPEFLSDGRHFVYAAGAAEQSKSGIYLASLDDPAGRRLLADVSSIIYAPPAPGSRMSHLLFLRGNTLMAQPFDAKALQLTGDPVSIAEQASPSFTPQGPAVAAANGVLVYLTNQTNDRQLAWFDRSGRELGKVGPVRPQRGLALSPDGRAVLFSLPNGVWLHDLPRSVETRLTEVAENAAPTWSADGSRIVFTKNQDLYVKASSGSGAEELLLHSGNVKRISDWSRDGRFILYTEDNPKTLADIWYLADPLKPGTKQPITFLATKSIESQAQFSPDGKLAAYCSDESGLNEVYVRPFPPGPGQWRVSTNGGREPRWRRNGEELFYLETAGRSMGVMAVTVHRSAHGAPQFSAPHKLFEYRGIGTVIQRNAFAYTSHPDGQRFLVNMDADTVTPELNVILKVLVQNRVSAEIGWALTH